MIDDEFSRLRAANEEALRFFAGDELPPAPTVAKPKTKKQRGRWTRCNLCNASIYVQAKDDMLDAMRKAFEQLDAATEAVLEHTTAPRPMAHDLLSTWRLADTERSELLSAASKVAGLLDYVARSAAGLCTERIDGKYCEGRALKGRHN